MFQPLAVQAPGERRQGFAGTVEGAWGFTGGGKTLPFGRAGL